MDSDLIFGLIGAVSGLVAGVVGAYVTLRKSRQDIKTASSQEVVNLATALNQATSTFLAVSADNLKQEAHIDELEKRLDEADRLREERNKEIAELKESQETLTQVNAELQMSIERLNREYTREIANLNLSWERKYSELETKNTNQKKAIELLAKVLKDNDLTMPEELKLLLGDSVDKLRWDNP